MSRGYLLVRVEGKAYGLPLARVLEVGDLAEVLDVPRALPAMRGLTPLRGRLVPVVHLGALLGERTPRSEEHTSELQSRLHLVCRLLLEKKKKKEKRTNGAHTVEEHESLCPQLPAC